MGMHRRAEPLRCRRKLAPSLIHVQELLLQALFEFTHICRDAYIHVGDLFVVERVSKTFTDPSTGQVLGQRKQTLGVVEIESVQESLSVGTFSPLNLDPPQRGDLVSVAPEN